MNRDVFINCPFTSDYTEFFEAINFTVIYCGFTPRCALETDDASENRFQKICDIIADCRLGIHDISNTKLDRMNRLPRFNMPLELGLFLGAKRFGTASSKAKKCLILDHEKYRYQKFISDLAGQDIHAHHDKVTVLVKVIAGWLRSEFNDNRVPGGAAVFREFAKFQLELPKICRQLKLKRNEVIFSDFKKIAVNWIAQRLSTAT
jgi:hypothetical protein